MLFGAVSVYVTITLLIGYVASWRVKSVEDYTVAGRRLPLVMCSSAFFATWFGAETILGASAEFARHGVRGVIEDPFGAAVCLILVGVFFVKALYKFQFVSIGDYFRYRYGKRFEALSSAWQAISYFTYTAGQFIALGIVFQLVSGADFTSCMLIGAFVVVLYTYMGGMWALAITDLVQTIVILAGLLFLTLYFVDKAGDLQALTPFFKENDTFNILPNPSLPDYARYGTAWIAIGLGAIPSQDIFQRIMSAKSEKVARQSALLGAFLYLSIATLPMLIVVCAKVLYPEITLTDTQNYLPTIILKKSPIWAQVFFFGALISAIMSTASASLLAQATVIGENLIKPYWNNKDEGRFLTLIKGLVIIVAGISVWITCYQHNIYKLVGESSLITLITLFIPLVAGLYWKRATSNGAFLSLWAGFIMWFCCRYIWNAEAYSWLCGFLASALGMVIGSVVIVRK